jgi:uncharacterized protein (DUF1499 family)
MRTKLIIICSAVILLSINVHSQSDVAKSDTLIKIIPLTFQGKKLSTKFTKTIDTLVSFSPVDYTSVESYTQYEAPEEVIKFVEKLEDYAEREALLKMYSKRIITNYKPKQQPNIIKLK